jgi:hypothetical protein
MTREEFIQILDKKGYSSYKIEGDKIIVIHNGYVDLESLETLPPGVEFKNAWSVHLSSLKTIPPGVEFNNRGDVNLESLKTIHPGVEFNNRGDVYLDSLIGYYSREWKGFSDWKGNIEGIDSNTLLNGMIKRGIFL